MKVAGIGSGGPFLCQVMFVIASRSNGWRNVAVRVWSFHRFRSRRRRSGQAIDPRRARAIERMDPRVVQLPKSDTRFSVNIQNLLNKTNLSQPIGNLAVWFFAADYTDNTDQDC